MRSVRVLLSMLLVIVAGCASPSDTSSEPDWIRFGCEGVDSPASMVDGVFLDGRLYERVYSSPAYAREDQRGPSVGVVDCDRNVLPASQVDETPVVEVWELSGFERSFRLVVGWTEGLVLYESRPHGTETARTVFGDLEELVTGIEVLSEFDGETRLGHISDPEVATDLVTALLDGPILGCCGDGLRYFLALEFADAPPSIQVLFVDAAELYPGIEVPEWFVQTIIDAVDEYAATAPTTEATPSSWVLPESPTDGELMADAFLSLPSVAPLVGSLAVETTSDLARRVFFVAGDSGTIDVRHWTQNEIFDPEAIYGQPADVIANTTDVEGNPVIPDGAVLYGVVVSSGTLHLVGVDESGHAVGVIFERYGDAIPALSAVTLDDVVGWVVVLLNQAGEEAW